MRSDGQGPAPLRSQARIAASDTSRGGSAAAFCLVGAAAAGAGRFAAATAETQQLAKLVKELELKLLNKKPTIVEKVAAGPRTLRGGTGARDEGAAKKASSWWNR